MRRAVLSILLLGLLAGTAFAQGAGQITGVVSDNSGGVIPGVTVVAVESETGISRDTVTAANGRYSFPSLRPTTYELRAELSGFTAIRQTAIVLHAGKFGERWGQRALPDAQLRILLIGISNAFRSFKIAARGRVPTHRW